MKLRNLRLLNLAVDVVQFVLFCAVTITYVEGFGGARYFVSLRLRKELLFGRLGSGEGVKVCHGLLGGLPRGRWPDRATSADSFLLHAFLHGK